MAGVTSRPAGRGLVSAEQSSRATMRDVARVAGVSQGTVSRVVNNLPVREPAKSRILATMRELNYLPNFLAQSMRTRTTMAVDIARRRCRRRPSMWNPMSVCGVPPASPVPLDRQLHEFVDEVVVLDTAGDPQLGVHRDRGEPRHRVHLVEQEAATVFLEEEVDA